MFPEDPDDPRLPEDAEALLADWPLAHRSLDEWEALAASIDAKVRLSSIGDTPDELLDVPFADGQGEDRDMQRRSRPRMKRPSAGQLTLLAKASVIRDARALEQDQSAHTLLREAVKARSEARALVTTRPPQESVSGLATGSVGKAPRNSSRGERSSASLSSATNVASSTAVAGAVAQHRSMWLGIGFGMLGMAAAVLMYLGSTAPDEPSAQLLAEATRVSAPAEALAEPTQPKPSPASPAATLPAAAESVLKLEDVPMDEPNRVEAKARASLATGKAPVRQPAPAAQPSADDATTTDDRPPATGPSEPGMMMADSLGAAELPDKPSTGAVQVAVGSVMGAARACMAGQNAPSRARLSFGSDGRVRSVTVSGPATGTAAEVCLRTALSGARVQPFARPTFQVNLRIRPH